MSEEPIFYHLSNGHDVTGPYTLSQIKSMWQSGAVTADAMCCPAGQDAWLPVVELTEPRAETAARTEAVVANPLLSVVAMTFVAVGIFMVVAYGVQPKWMNFEHPLLAWFMGMPVFVGVITGVVFVFFGILVRILAAVAAKR